IYGHPFAEEAFKQLTYKDITTGIGYDPTKPLEIGPFTIHFLETNHSVPCFALRIEADGKSLVYTGDSAYTDAFIDFVRDADLLLSECNFYDGMDGSTAGHMNSKDAATIAAKGNVKQLVLTHLPHFGDVEKLPQEAKKYFSGPVHLAKKGQVWNI
ncbi:MAG: MBL fold metallo-hydrolase, partial [Caldibacillus sp.]